MEELKHILHLHAKRYPKMEPTDAVKLIYQNVFGGGHLIRDEESCLAFLHREYENTPSDPLLPLYEEIGNGIVRVNLAALPADMLPLLGQAFLRSAGALHGYLEAFLDKLEVLRSLCAEGVFAFEVTALDAYLAEYADAGYPPVSHSETYREAYHPAYRIVLKTEFFSKSQE